MRLYEARIALGPRFNDRRSVFRARAIGDVINYNDYISHENRLLDIVFKCLDLVSAYELTIVYREGFDRKSELYDSLTSDGLISPGILDKNTFRGTQEIGQVLRYLSRDLGFVTLGKVGKTLIVPCERLGFILCLPDEISFIQPDVVEVIGGHMDGDMITYGLKKVSDL